MLMPIDFDWLRSKVKVTWFKRSHFLFSKIHVSQKFSVQCSQNLICRPSSLRDWFLLLGIMINLTNRRRERRKFSVFTQNGYFWIFGARVTKPYIKNIDVSLIVNLYRHFGQCQRSGSKVKLLDKDWQYFAGM